MDALARAFEGVAGASVLNSPDYASSDLLAQAEQVISAIIEAAQRAHLSKIVALSSIGGHLPQGTGNILTVYKIEEKLKNLPAEVAIGFVRAAGFTDIIFQVLLCRVRYKLSYRDVAEFFLLRGFQFTHETVRDWEERFLPHFTEQIRMKRKGKIGKVWMIDETYLRVKGSWCYLYRGIDEDGNLVDVRLSQTRDMAGTKAFFAQAIDLHEETPKKVATDGLASYPRAIKDEQDEAVEHEVRPCTTNPVEQSHRRVKHRYYPTLGFGEFDAAQRFCRAVDEVGNFLRPRSRMAEFVCLSDRRERFMQGVGELEALFQTA